MAENKLQDQADIKNYKKEITQLKEKVEALEGNEQLATLKTKVDKLEGQEVNTQAADQRAMTDLSGFEEEFVRLKADTILQAKKFRTKQLWSTLGSLITIPASGIVIYYALNHVNFAPLLGFEDSELTLFYTIFKVVFALLEVQAIFKLIATICKNPEKLPDETLSYLSLTAKEHILDPKGSVIREKYGTSKWTSITET